MSETGEWRWRFERKARCEERRDRIAEWKDGGLREKEGKDGTGEREREKRVEKRDREGVYRNCEDGSDGETDIGRKGWRIERKRGIGRGLEGRESL